MPKISDLPQTGPITGAEQLVVVQGDATKRMPLGAFLEDTVQSVTEEAEGFAAAAGSAAAAALSRFEPGKNKFNPNGPFLANSQFSGAGAIQTSGAFADRRVYTDYIAVLPSTSYICNSAANVTIVWYDSAFAIIGAASFVMNNTTPRVSPSNAAFMRVSLFQGSTVPSALQIEIGAAPTAFEAFRLVLREDAAPTAAITAEQNTRLAADRSIDRIIRNSDRRHRIIVPFGDSRAAQETQTTSVNQPVMNARGALEWAAIRTGHRIMCDPLQNYGVGGETTTGFLARLDTVKRSTAPAVWIPGWINDSAQGVASAVTQANILAILRGLRDAGKIVFQGDDYPSPVLTAPQMDQHVLTRNYVRTLHNPAGGIYVVRSWDAIATAPDGTTPKADALADNLHPSTLGAFLISGPLMTQVQAAYRDPDIMGSLAANLVTNPDMVGSGGTRYAGATGQVADSWTTSGPAITGTGAVAFSKVTGADGRLWQQVAVSGSFSSTPAPVGISQNLPVGSFAAGDLVEFMLRLEVDGPTANMRSIVATLLFQNGQSSGQSGYQSPAQVFPTDGYSGVLHSQFVWPSGHTRITPLLSINFQSPSPAIVMRVRDWQARRIT